MEATTVSPFSRPATPAPARKRAAILTYYQDKAGKHRWQIRSSNGKVIAASSQGYATIADAQKNVMLLGALLGGYNGGYGDMLFVGQRTGPVKLWR